MKIEVCFVDFSSVMIAALRLRCSQNKNVTTVKPRFTAVFGGKEISAVNRGPR